MAIISPFYRQMSELEWITFGKLGRPHSLSGEIRFFAHHKGSKNRKQLDKIMLVRPQEKLVSKVTSFRSTSKHDILRIQAFSNRTAAEQWTNAELFVPKKWLPELSENEFYAFEFEGLRAIDQSGNLLGEVLSLANYGGGDLLIIKLFAFNKEVIIPFAEPFVGSLDQEKRSVVVFVEDFL